MFDITSPKSYIYFKLACIIHIRNALNITGQRKSLKFLHTILASSANTDCRSFQVKINYSCLAIDTTCPSFPVTCLPAASPVDNFAERASPVSIYASPANKWKFSTPVIYTRLFFENLVVPTKIECFWHGY